MKTRECQYDKVAEVDEGSSESPLEEFPPNVSHFRRFGVKVLLSLSNLISLIFIIATFVQRSQRQLTFATGYPTDFSMLLHSLIRSYQETYFIQGQHGSTSSLNR